MSDLPLGETARARLRTHLVGQRQRHLVHLGGCLLFSLHDHGLEQPTPVPAHRTEPA